MNVEKLIKKRSIEVFNQSRALLYTLESLPLPLLFQAITGEKPQPITKEQQQMIIKKSQNLLKIDAQDFSDLELPLTLLQPGNSREHIYRWLQVVFDSTRSFQRRRKKKTDQFSNKIKNLEDYPDYYKRNFHHQTDGYLTTESAKLYEHQVELLFRGLAEPMRRRLLKPILGRLKKKKKLKILEVGCGTGTMTRYLAHLFPNAEIIAVDMSPAYIQYAKRRWIEYPNLHFSVENGESLPYKDQTFDAVVSVFMHHELPEKVRKKVIKESLRVCKPQGFWGLLDSIQLGDDPDLDWALKEFPKNFHEPFYANYIKKPLIPLMDSLKSDRKFKQDVFLLSKVVYTD
jgi:ubiquinone/menaquinone biosynthesis C-methylase UbiE